MLPLPSKVEDILLFDQKDLLGYKKRLLIACQSPSFELPTRCLKTGKTMLHMAAFFGWVDVLEAIYHWRPLRPSFNVASEHGNIIHYSTMGNHPAIIEWASKHPDLQPLLSSPNDKGRTPLMMAEHFPEKIPDALAMLTQLFPSPVTDEMPAVSSLSMLCASSAAGDGAAGGAPGPSTLKHA